MINDWNGVVEQAEKELDLVGMKDIPIGKAMLDLLTLCVTETRNPAIMKIFANMVVGFVDKKILSPVNEDDFDKNVSRESGRDILKCKRSEDIYKDIEDNKYYDNKAVGYISLSDSEPNRILYLYNSKQRSRREVKLPYMPDYKIEYIP